MGGKQMSKEKVEKEEVKKLTNKKGITLIALVITIIVLLILAGITISTLTSDNGIIDNAYKAKNETRIAELQGRLDEIGFEVYQNDVWLEDEEYMAEYEKQIKEDDMFKNAQKVERHGLEIDVISEEGYIFYISEDKVEYAGVEGDKLPSIDITISAGENINKKVTLTVNIENNINRRVQYTIYRDNTEVRKSYYKRKQFYL